MQSFQTRNDLLSIIPKNCIFAEIGVFQGAFSKIIFKYLEPNELHLIDVFEGTICSGDRNGENLIWANLNHEFNVLKNFFKTEKNARIHKGKSSDVLNGFPDNYFDAIYIDGDHSYECALIDLELAKNKIKKGGIILGHDYCEKMPGVLKAVNEFIFINNFKIDFITLDVYPSFGIINNK
jgi:hypothetical protein